MNKAIEIEEMRISSNGSHFEFTINCPSEYYFSDFIVTNEDGDSYSLNEVFLDEDGEYITDTGNRFSNHNVSVEDLGMNRPGVYRAKLVAKLIEQQGACNMPEGYEDTEIFEIGEDDIIYDKRFGFPVIIGVEPLSNYRWDEVNKTVEMYDPVNNMWVGYTEGWEIYFYVGYTNPLDEESKINVYNVNDVFDENYLRFICEPAEDSNPCEKYPEELIKEIIISDVSHIYNCLSDDILALDAKCVDKESQDRVIRNYMILYAHQEAMKLGLYDEAVKWFHMMDNCFTGRCKGFDKRNGSTDCGCGTSKPVERPCPPKPCGCKR